MQKEWAVYKVICVVEFVFSIGISIILLLSMLSLLASGEDRSVIFDPFPIITFLLFLCMAFFHGLCLRLILKKYPNKEISENADTIFSMFTFITLFVFVIMAAVLIYGIVETIQSFKTDDDDYTKYYTLIFGVIYLSGHLYCLKQAWRLRKKIKENFIETQNTEIDSIGITEHILPQNV
jgi:cytochrome bd-type quinol oxidase subunit 2